MATYAENTTVSIDKSRFEIERILSKYGASEFGYATSGNKAAIMFIMNGRKIRFILVLPNKNSDEFVYTPAKRYMRSPEEQIKAWEQACRSKWRSLLEVIKAKLIAVSDGISVFEEEFLANIMMPNNMTVGENLLPQIDDVYERGLIPSNMLLNS